MWAYFRRKTNEFLRKHFHAFVLSFMEILSFKFKLHFFFIFFKFFYPFFNFFYLALQKINYSMSNLFPPNASIRVLLLKKGWYICNTNLLARSVLILRPLFLYMDLKVWFFSKLFHEVSLNLLLLLTVLFPIHILSSRVLSSFKILQGHWILN